MNYFSVLCFAWAGIGLITRVLIVVLGPRWNQWELARAYPPGARPTWVTAVCVVGILLVLWTWTMVWRGAVPNSWIAAALLTLTLLKIGLVLLDYKKFRGLARRVLTERLLLERMHLAVLVLSVLLCLLGAYYWG